MKFRDIYVFGVLNGETTARWHRITGVEAESQGEANSLARNTAHGAGVRYDDTDLPIAQNSDLINDLDGQVLNVIAVRITDAQLRALDDLTEQNAQRLIDKYDLDT